MIYDVYMILCYSQGPPPKMLLFKITVVSCLPQLVIQNNLKNSVIQLLLFIFLFCFKSSASSFIYVCFYENEKSLPGPVGTD